MKIIRRFFNGTDDWFVRLRCTKDCRWRWLAAVYNARTNSRVLIHLITCSPSFIRGQNASHLNGQARIAAAAAAVAFAGPTSQAASQTYFD